MEFNDWFTKYFIPENYEFKQEFTQEEKEKLRPIAETIAMLEGNAFFGNVFESGAEWYEMYLPEAHFIYETNGGDLGWSGAASFAKKFVTEA